MNLKAHAQAGGVSSPQCLVDDVDHRVEFVRSAPMGNETTSFWGLSGLHSNGCDGGHETEVPHDPSVS